ncbi:GNAT family N-acetyltransferase [Tahibacter amnicola]|uniref:GNAT family N-acetyltransferase n=1 Tax=Tahibacter amnicola TaxID=2976241 RepID=A0ABY6BKF6_9GAMM|nr:GNAT family N-acetyltransferase [Tahibacter amnicola]UXI70503.1 GNAT family N-acetyltransferase [Tahibacter amnicola]
MQAPVIRHYEAADLAQVHAIYAEPAAFANTLQLPYASLAHWEHKLGDRPGFTCLVALRGDEIVGQLGLDVCTAPRRRHVATLGMGVKASARRTGVGAALLQAAIELCEQWLNVSRIELEVYTDNAAAIALYQQHGFVIEGTCRQDVFRDGELVDVHVMARLRQARG